MPFRVSTKAPEPLVARTKLVVAVPSATSTFENEAETTFSVPSVVRSKVKLPLNRAPPAVSETPVPVSRTNGPAGSWSRVANPLTTKVSSTATARVLIASASEPVSEKLSTPSETLPLIRPAMPLFAPPTTMRAPVACVSETIACAPSPIANVPLASATRTAWPVAVVICSKTKSPLTPLPGDDQRHPHSRHAHERAGGHVDRDGRAADHERLSNRVVRRVDREREGAAEREACPGVDADRTGERAGKPAVRGDQQAADGAHRHEPARERELAAADADAHDLRAERVGRLLEREARLEVEALNGDLRRRERADPDEPGRGVEVDREARGRVEDGVRERKRDVDTQGADDAGAPDRQGRGRRGLLRRGEDRSRRRAAELQDGVLRGELDCRQPVGADRASEREVAVERLAQDDDVDVRAGDAYVRAELELQPGRRHSRAGSPRRTRSPSC